MRRLFILSLLLVFSLTTILAEEHVVGYYTTDELPPDYDEFFAGVGLQSYPGQQRVGVIFEQNVVGAYVGDSITKVRFALASPIPIYSAYVYEVDTSFAVGECLAEVDLGGESAEVGWNVITLPTPVVIEDGKFYLVGFEYYQYDDYFMNISYPLLTDEDIKTDVTPTYGFLLYGNLSTRYGYDWYEVTIDDGEGGNLCVQAIVGTDDTPEGILSPRSDSQSTEVTRYSLDGKQLSAPAKGVNLLRFSDGSTKKLLVK